MGIVLSSKSSPKKHLRYWLHKHLSGSETARPITRIHASDLFKEETEFCPREYALLDLTGKKRRDPYITTATRVVWAASSDGQMLITKWFVEMGRAVGDWRCVSCGALHTFTKYPSKCVKGCVCKHFQYVETRFCSLYSGVSGGVDLLVDMDEPKLRIVEIKSIQKEDFKPLAGPLAEHKIRTNLYMRLAEESDHPAAKHVNVDEALVLYMSKGGWGAKDPLIHEWKIADGPYSPFKEFRVKRDDSETQDHSERARKVLMFRQNGLVPDGVCPTSVCQRAKACRVAKECFSGQFKAGSTVKLVGEQE